MDAFNIGWLGLSMVASYALGDALFLWSCHAIGIPAALAIASAYPLWTALAGLFFKGEWLKAHQWAGLLITIGGVVVVILAGARSRGEKGGFKKGALLAIGVSFLWALNSYAVAVGASDLIAPVGNTIRMTFALVLTWVAKSVLEPRSRLILPAAELKTWGWLFAFEAFGGSFMFMYGLANAPLAIAAALSSLAPVLSVPVAWAMRTEPVSWIKTSGILAVVGGVVMLLWS